MPSPSPSSLLSSAPSVLLHIIYSVTPSLVILCKITADKRSGEGTTREEGNYEESCTPAFGKTDYYFELYKVPFCKEFINDNDPSTSNDTALIFTTSSISSRGRISLKNNIGVDRQMYYIRILCLDLSVMEKLSN